MVVVLRWPAPVWGALGVRVLRVQTFMQRERHS
jgi:hypothetical protein